MRLIENSICAILLPVSACSMPAIIIDPNVEANIKKIKINRNIVPPRSITESVGYAFRYRPMG